MIRRMLVATVALSIAMTLAAPEGFAQQPKRGGTLRMAEREAPNLDPTCR